jgi:hypothetical protein
MNVVTSRMPYPPRLGGGTSVHSAFLVSVHYYLLRRRQQRRSITVRKNCR